MDKKFKLNIFFTVYFPKISKEESHSVASPCNKEKLDNRVFIFNFLESLRTSNFEIKKSLIWQQKLVICRVSDKNCLFDNHPTFAGK